jgi:hypothetical protein
MPFAGHSSILSPVAGRLADASPAESLRRVARAGRAAALTGRRAGDGTTLLDLRLAVAPIYSGICAAAADETTRDNQLVVLGGGETSGSCPEKRLELAQGLAPWVHQHQHRRRHRHPRSSSLNGGKLLQSDTVNKLQTPQVLTSGKETEYGLGWMVEEVTLAGQPTRMVHHASRTLKGGTTSFMTFRARGMVVALTANIVNPITRDIALNIAQAFAEHGTSPAR